MRYLENAFKFTFKNFLITLPLLISMAIPALIMNIGTIGFTNDFTQKFTQLIQDNNQNIDYMNSSDFFNDITDIFKDIINPTFIACMLVGGVLYLIFSLLVYPATYGLINKKYETGNSTLSDFTSCMSKYIGRYVQYILLMLAIGIGLTIVMAILTGISAVIISQVSAAAGILLMVLFYLAFIVGCIALKTYMSLWFPAVCIEDSGVTEGLKNSFRKVKGSFWIIFGITILVSICGSVAGGILGWVPLIGSVISSVISTLAGFVTILFYFEVYRDKTGRYTVPEDFQQIDGQIQ
jgi:hypothetical protein